MGTALGVNGPAGGGDGIGFADVRPQHHRAALTVVGGTGVDRGTLLHRHRGGLVQGVGVVKHATLGVGTPLPVTPDQHLAATRGTCGGGGAARGQGDVITREHNATAHLAQAVGADAAAVAHHAALDALQRAGRQDHPATFGLDHMAVVHQGLPVAGFHHHALELVVGVELQGNGFARSQRHAAFVGHDHAAVAHLGCEQGHVALQVGGEFAIIDNTARDAVALKTQVATGHEGVVADAVCGGQQAAHVHPAACAKEHTVAVADEDLPGGADAAQDGAGLGSGDAVEGGARAVVELDMGVFAHIETLPVEHSALAALLNDHVRTRLTDAGRACGHTPPCGQCVVSDLCMGA